MGMNNSAGSLLLAQTLFKKPRKNQNVNVSQIERHEQEVRILDGLDSFDTNNFTAKP